MKPATQLITEPLNGTSTHPLTAFARLQLQRLKAGPVPSNQFNPGVVRRFLVGEAPLAEVEQLRSPFPGHHGKKLQHLKITTAGLAALEAKPS